MFYFKQNLNDKDLLIVFLEDTYRLIESICMDKQGVMLILFPKYMRIHISAAWKEFSQVFDLNVAKEKVKVLSDEQMKHAGLFGMQLQLKLRLIRNRGIRWMKYRGKQTLKKLFDAIDTLLDSLIFATGIDEALKEFKDILNNSLG